MPNVYDLTTKCGLRKACRHTHVDGKEQHIIAKSKYYQAAVEEVLRGVPPIARSPAPDARLQQDFQRDNVDAKTVQMRNMFHFQLQQKHENATLS